MGNYTIEAFHMRLLMFITLFLFAFLSNGQEKYNFEKIDINEMYNIEAKNESIFIDSIDFGISLGNFSSSKFVKTKTFIFKRTNDDFSPKLHVWYHISSDKIIAITYNWDFYNPKFNPDKNRELIFSTNKREKEYLQKYKELNKLLQGILGSPNNTNLINDSDYSFNEMTYWENSELFAHSRFRFQRTIDESPMIGLANNHFVVQMFIEYK